MRLSEYLIEAVAKRSTGKYSDMVPSKNQNFEEFLHAVESVYSHRLCLTSAAGFSWNENFTASGVAAPNVAMLAKEAEDIIRNGDARIVIRYIPSGGKSMFLYDPLRRAGFYIGFFDNGKLNSISMFVNNTPPKSGKVQLVVDKDFSKIEPTNIDKKLDFFNRWLYDTPF